MEPAMHIDRIAGAVMDAAAEMTILEQAVRAYPHGNPSQDERDWAAAHADRLVQAAKVIRDLFTDPDWRGPQESKEPTADNGDYGDYGGIGDLP